MAKEEAKSRNQKTGRPQTHSTATAKHRPPLPSLLDFSFSIASLVTLLAGVVTVVLSLLHGVSVVMAAIRGCVAVFCLGAVLWLLNYFLANQVIQTAAADLKAAQADLDKGESTREFQA
ncbi:MAG: hypothetical protein ACK44E_12585 [Anaerolineales bacterium]